MAYQPRGRKPGSKNQTPRTDEAKPAAPKKPVVGYGKKAPAYSPSKGGKGGARGDGKGVKMGAESQIPPAAVIHPGMDWRASLIKWATDPLTPGPAPRPEGGVGRPRYVVTEEMCQEVFRLASTGYRDQDIAQAMGLHSRTLYEKCIEFPQLSLAIKAGRKQHLDADLAHLNRMKTSNIVATLFSMKAIHGFREEPLDAPADAASEGNTIVISDRIREAMSRVRR